MSIELDVTVQSPIDLDVSVTDPIYLDLAESAIIYIADANPTALTHNSLVSIQGGTTAQYYHLSSANYTIATQAASTTLAGYLTSANFTIFNNKLDTNGSAANLTNFPSSLATVTGSEALTNKTYNGLTLTAETIGFTITGGTTPKTLTIPLDATVSGTNTGDNSVNTLYSGLVSNATHTGDVTGSTALTLATVNSNVGSFGSTSAIPIITVNGKGLITAISTGTVTYAGSALTGTSLASNILTSSLTTIGTLTDLTVTNTITGSISGSAPSLKSTTTTGVLQATGMTTGTTRVKTVRDADDTLLELGGTYTPTGTWNWGTATVTWPTFNQSTTGTATNATNAVNIGITNDATTNDTMYPVWVTANTGNLPSKTTSTKLTFNPSTGNLTSTTFTGNFVGNLTGNVSGVVNADTVVGLVVDSGQVLTVNQTMTLYAADNTGVYTFPTGTNTLARTNAGQTFIGVNTFTSPTINTSITSSATFAAFNDATALTIGANTAAQTINFGTGATISGATKTINIGTAGVSGSTTQINIGSTYGTTVLVNDDLTVTGDLVVNGTTFTVHSGTVIVEDKNIELGSVTTPTDTTADGGGITLKGTSDKTIIWDNANDNWTLNQNVNIPTSFTYKINNTSVLSSTVVLGLTPTIQATGFALAGGTSSKTITVNDSTAFGTNTITLGGGEIITFSATNALSLLTTGSTSVTLPTTGTLVSSVTTGNGVSATNTAGALAFTLGAITPSTVNALTLAAQTVGFTIAGGTTSKTLTVPLDASVSGTNTGDNAANTSSLPISGGTLTGHLLFTDNTYDIGASGATRPRTGYFGTSLISPLFNGLTITNNGTNTLTIVAGKTLTVSKTMQLTSAGDLSVITLPNSTDTLIGLATTDSITGVKTFDKDTIVTKGTSTGTTTISTANTSASNYTATLQAATGTIAYQADTFYIGTTQVALNRTSAPLTLAGITLTTPDIGSATGSASLNLLLTGGTLTGNLLFSIDNTLDIGASGATRPRTIYTGTSVVSPSVLASANDSGAIGASGTAFSDLFLASGGVINWDAANATLTHSAGLLTSNVPLSLGTSNSFTCGSIELGAASDTTISRSGAGAIQVEGVQVLLSGAALGTPSSGTVTNLTGTASININGTVGATSPTTIVGTTIQANTGFLPDANDGAYLGTTSLSFSDLFLASGAVINYANSDTVLTHSTGTLTLGTGTFKITTPTNTTTSVVTIDGTQTLTNKTILLTNNTWLTSYDSLGISANILKLAEDNTIDFGAPVNISSFTHLPDTLYTISNVPVDTAEYGTEVGVNFIVGGTLLLKVSGLSDGAGGLISTSVPSALTTKLTQITHTAPGTPDYAIQDLTNSSAYGFVTKDEGNTVLSVILNLQQRVDQLETRLISMGILL